MQTILRLLGGSIGPWLMGIVAVSLLGSVGSCSYEGWWASHYKNKAAVAVADLKQATDTLAINEAVVDSLTRSLEAWKRSAENAASAQEKLTAALADQQRQLDAAHATIKAQEIADNALPDCQKFLGIDVARVCPGHAASVRMRATDHLSGSNNQRAGPGPH